MRYNLNIKPFGERAILIEWPPVIDEDILKDIIRLKKSMEKNNIKGIVELRLSYNSLLVVYDISCFDFYSEVSTINKIYSKVESGTGLSFRLWAIPVCYDDEFGIDLRELSEEKGLSKTEIVRLHSEAVYTVYFIGFLPGFLYLGGLNEALYMPRKSTPRLQVEKGAVAIGGGQTGIYPMASPGGWNVIGNSPISFFNTKNSPPCFAKPGDKIKFTSVSLEDYKSIKILVDANVYQLESEVIHG